MGRCVASKGILLLNATLMEYIFDKTGYFIPNLKLNVFISSIKLAKIRDRVTIDYIRGKFYPWCPNSVYKDTYYSSNDDKFLVNIYKINKDIEKNNKNITALNKADK